MLARERIRPISAAWIAANILEALAQEDEDPEAAPGYWRGRADALARLACDFGGSIARETVLAALEAGGVRVEDAFPAFSEGF